MVFEFTVENRSADEFYCLEDIEDELLQIEEDEGLDWYWKRKKEVEEVKDRDDEFHEKEIFGPRYQQLLVSDGSAVPMVILDMDLERARLTYNREMLEYMRDQPEYNSDIQSAEALIEYAEERFPEIEKGLRQTVQDYLPF